MCIRDRRDSKRMGNAGDHIDYALLLDGLKAEREQEMCIRDRIITGRMVKMTNWVGVWNII